MRPHRWQPTRLPRPWDSPGKNTGVGCHFLLQCMKVKSESEVAQSCPTLSDLMDCSLPGSSIHGIFQAGVLEWGCHCLLCSCVLWFINYLLCVRGSWAGIEHSSREVNGNPLQYSCLENPVDRGAWWAAVHRVAQSRTRLKWVSMHACIGEGNDNSIQYSCLENPRDRGTWWVAIYGVAQSQTRLKWLSSSSSRRFL